MDVNRNVLDGVALYMLYREAQATADKAEDKLAAHTRHMSEREHQAYSHITGMYDIAHGASMPSMMPPPTFHAESVPMPALTPERLAAMDTTRAELSR